MTTKERTFEEWQLQLKLLKELEASSIKAPAARVIGGTQLQATMELVNKYVENPETRHRIDMMFRVMTKYEALDEIATQLLVDDRDLVVQILDVAAGSDADLGEIAS